MSEEPISTNPNARQTLVCVDPSSGGAEGAPGAGATALVERFGGSQGGASGTGEAPEAPMDGPSCSDDALRAIAACGAAAFATTETGGVGAVFSGFGCVGAVEGYLECLENQERSR
jgi:hypothetical protein